MGDFYLLCGVIISIPICGGGDAGGDGVGGGGLEIAVYGLDGLVVNSEIGNHPAVAVGEVGNFVRFAIAAVDDGAAVVASGGGFGEIVTHG